MALLCFCVTLETGLRAAESLAATVVTMRFVKPLDEALILELAAGHELLVTLEENASMGGAGSAVSEFLGSKGLQARVTNLGLPDVFLEHGTQKEQLADAGLAPDQVAQKILGLLENR